MPIQQITTNFTGEVAVLPRIVRLLCNDSYATVTAMNYLRQNQIQGSNALVPTDFVAVSYSGGFGWFNPSFSGTNITLVPTPAPGDAMLPVTSGNFSVFSGTAGLVHDAGFLPSNAALTHVSMANGSFTAGNLLKAADATGSIADTGTRILADQTPVWGGGSAFNTYSLPGLLSTSALNITLVSFTNPCTAYATPARDSFTVTFSTDPGANTVLSYMAAIAPLS